jgi:catechol-2,3-dioxygenase
MSQGIDVVGMHVQDQAEAVAFRDPSGNGWKMIDPRRH